MRQTKGKYSAFKCGHLNEQYVIVTYNIISYNHLQLLNSAQVIMKTFFFVIITCNLNLEGI